MLSSFLILVIQMPPFGDSYTTLISIMRKDAWCLLPTWALHFLWRRTSPFLWASLMVSSCTHSSWRTAQWSISDLVISDSLCSSLVRSSCFHSCFSENLLPCWVVFESSCVSGNTKMTSLSAVDDQWKGWIGSSPVVWKCRTALALTVDFSLRLLLRELV